MMAGFAVLLLLTLLSLSQLGLSTPEGDEYLRSNAKKRGVKITESGMQYRVVKAGSKAGLSPNETSTCHVHYKGSLISGQEFDSSYKRGKPTSFRPKDVIKGWNEALRMMKEGDKWELVLPPSLAYGNRKAGKHITPDSVLLFEMELVRVDPDADGGFLSGLLDVIPPSLKSLPTFVYFLVAYLIYTIISGAGWTSAAKNLKKVALKEVQGNIGNRKVFMDIAISGIAGSAPFQERIEIELFSSLVPKTSTNFLYLCTGERGNSSSSGKPLHFLNSFFHRVIPGFMAQGGDFDRGNGTGGESVYGAKFADEFELGYVGHTEPYLLSMANAGPNTNGSQFFITFRATPHLDGKHVVFGKVVSGQHFIKTIEKYGTSTGKPKAVIQINGCGELKATPKEESSNTTTADDEHVKKTN